MKLDSVSIVMHDDYFGSVTFTFSGNLTKDRSFRLNEDSFISFSSMVSQLVEAVCMPSSPSPSESFTKLTHCRCDMSTLNSRVFNQIALYFESLHSPSPHELVFSPSDLVFLNNALQSIAVLGQFE